MKTKLSNKINKMVKEEYSKQINEIKFMGKEYSLEDIKNAAIAIGLSAAVVGGLVNELQKEADEDAEMSAWEQSDEGRHDRQMTYDLVNGTYNGLDECINKTLRSSLKRYI